MRWLWLSLVVVLVMLNVGLSRSVPPGPPMLALACLAVVLELSSLRCSLSAAPPIYLAAALLPGQSSAPGAFLALGLVILRTALRRGQSLEAALELIPILSGMLATVLLQPAWVAGSGAALLYLLTSWFLPRWMPLSSEWLQGYLASRGLGSALLFLAPPIATLVAVSPWHLLWLAPLLLALPRVADLTVAARAAREQEGLLEREKRSQQALAQAHRRLSSTHQALADQTEARILLEDLSGRLSLCADLDQTCQEVLSCLFSLLPLDHAAIYLSRAEGLVAYASRGQLKEMPPLVLRCWEEGAVTVDRTGSSAAALPLAGEGVLFVARQSRGGFRDEEGRLLALLAGHSGLGIQSAQRFTAQKEALEQNERARAKLAVWLERLSFLLEGVRSLALALSRDEIASRLEQLLQHTLQPVGGALLSPSGEPLRLWGQAGSLEVARAEGARALERKSPIFSESGILVCPLLTEAGPVGSLTLWPGRPFTREQSDIAQLISFQAAVVLRNASLYEDVVQAKAQLELSQAQLIQSSKLAAVGQLAAGVAHELNTPLASVLLEIESAELRLETKPGLVPAKLARARESALACKAIIAKLLLYAREQVHAKAEVDLNTVACKALEMFGHQLTFDGVELTTKFAPQLPPVSGQANELQQVVVNLLLNARDAVRGSQRRRVELATMTTPGWVGLYVQDQGCGMTPEVLERAFDPFFTTKDVGQGTGLGLSVSLQICQQHGGRLIAESRPLEGTRVTLWLPALQ